MSDEIAEPWHGQTFISANPPPSHTHLQADVTDLAIWQASIERSLADHATLINAYRYAIIALTFLLVMLGVLFLLVVG